MVWERRFPRLIADIACHMPTVLNLQEVDRLEDFQRHLGPLGCERRCASADGPVSLLSFNIWPRSVSCSTDT